MESLRKIRLASGKKLREIAEVLKLTVPGYSKYETDKGNPPIEKLIELADYYDVTLDYLVGRPYSNEFGYLDDQEKAMLKTFRALSDTGKTKVASYSLGILAMEN